MDLPWLTDRRSKPSRWLFSESYKSSSALVRCIISGKIEQLKQMIKFEGELIEKTPEPFKFSYSR